MKPFIIYRINFLMNYALVNESRFHMLAMSTITTGYVDFDIFKNWPIDFTVEWLVGQSANSALKGCQSYRNHLQCVHHINVNEAIERLLWSLLLNRFHSGRLWVRTPKFTSRNKHTEDFIRKFPTDINQFMRKTSQNFQKRIMSTSIHFMLNGRCDWMPFWLVQFNDYRKWIKSHLKCHLISWKRRFVAFVCLILH